MSCEGILQEITLKCANLFYRGESSNDSQMVAFQSTVRGALTASNFLKSLGMQPLETSIDERVFATVLNNQINLENGAVFWEDMKSYLEGYLTDLRVFVIGNVQTKIYICGLHEGYALGAYCEAIES